MTVRRRSRLTFRPVDHISDPQAHEKDPLTHAIIGAAIRVNRGLGVGLLESAYETFLCHELEKLNLDVSRQPPMPVLYDGIRLDLGFRPDIIVNGSVIIEIKTVAKVLPVHEAQLLTSRSFGVFGVFGVFGDNALGFPLNGLDLPASSQARQPD